MQAVSHHSVRKSPHFQKDSDRRIAFGKVSDYTDKVIDIAGKTGNALCDYHVDFSALCVGNHLKKLFSFIQRSAGDTLISVDFNERPVRVLDNEVFIILLCNSKDVVCRTSSVETRT